METSSDTLIFYEFSRSKVERRNFSHFLGHFAVEELPTGRRLREMKGNVVLCVGGYDDDERELYSIPEVRAFYRTLHTQWPYALYFSHLEFGALKILAYCCIDKLTDMKVDGESKVLVRPDLVQMTSFLLSGFAAMNVICKRAEMFTPLINQRTNAVLEYFGLPTESPNDGGISNTSA